ncbi:MAG: L-rhamnose isomerase [Phycisphaeraceae bacterium]|nr:L-rhamnose isomerase [Phycisphaeraceae bacterium]
MNESGINRFYESARDQYAEAGVDTEAAISTLLKTPVSIHCWQGDDVAGFERPDSTLSGGGIQAVGNYPGRARTIDELRLDLDQVLALVPGQRVHRLNLHAIYGDFGGRTVDRDAIGPEHFASWIDWAGQRGLGIDFNPTCFSHPLAEDGFTLSHPDSKIRDFWIAHCAACRRIAAEMGRALGGPSICNVWVPDGYKDLPVDRLAPRRRLLESLNTLFADSYDPAHLLDSLESKLFGIGSEAYVVGSHEFYLGYAIKHGKLLCLDSGHFHPTESIADKLSSMLVFVDRLLLHVSRGVRWDSDHVVIQSDELLSLAEQIVRCEALGRVHIGLDFFDASINRIAAWVIGVRATQQALLQALLQPLSQLRDAEQAGDHTARLAMLETARAMPWQAVWAQACLRAQTPLDYLEPIRAYEQKTLALRA